MSSSSSAFPTAALVPKRETRALAFQESYPEYNGKGVTIGVLDTGIDPGATGLWTCPDGTPKLIGLYDCTGSGDVDVSKEETAELISEEGGEGEGGGGEEGTKKERKYWKVKGISDKILYLPGDWNIQPFPTTEKEEQQKQEEEQKKKENQDKTETKEEEEETKQDETKEESDTKEKEETKEESSSAKVIKTCKVRIGIKRGYELYPKKLVSRVKEHRTKELNQSIDKRIAQVRDQITQWNKANGSKPTPEQLRQKQDLEARLSVLQDSEWQNEPGPIYDCVVFWDGTTYRAAIDTQEDGKPQKAMAAFSIHREYDTFSTVDQYNYCVNFYNDAKILSIVCDVGAHASHVAGIATAFEPNGSHGVAPGAKLIGFKIGDTRLGSMETGTALCRALIQAIQLKVDVINLSYGEGAAIANSGRFVEMARELVFRHNIVFVSSAGNNGPAISTVGAPGGTSTPCLGIAAYVSPAMRKVHYSLMDKDGQVGTTYTWSSVGPTTDGDNGVNLTAPGGAITCVPNWCLQKLQLMNGTSMSSPHAAGCVALLLSACKAEGIPITPSRIQKAMENTAHFMPNLSTLQQGWGMIQVDKAWEHLKAQKDCDTEDLHFGVCVENRSGNPRGVYLRQPEETKVKHNLAISVDPLFRKDDVDEATQKAKCNLEIKFRLESTAHWVKAPEFFVLIHNGRSFKIDVDPTILPPGVHTAKVCGYDTERPGRGVVFSLPITVVKTMEEAQHISLGDLRFEPTEVKRFFLSVPAGATWMDVTVKDTRDDTSDSSARLMVLHTVQLLQHAAYRDAECEKYFQMTPHETKVASVRVHAGVTCELDLARYWSATGSTGVNVSVQFRGVRSMPDKITPGTCVRLFSDIKNEIINPSAKLTKWKTPLRPKADSEISPLPDDRDVLPSTNKRIYQLLLTYEFDQEETGSFTPRAPMLQGVLYESAYESQMVLIFDGDKKYLGVGDAWPGEVQANKGKVVIRIQVRHDDPAMLEKLKDMMIWIERKLDKDISLSTYTTKENMMVGASTFRRRTLRKGCSASLFFSEPAPSKLPSGAKAGDILFGTATYCGGEGSLPGDGKRPGGFAISYVVGPKPAKSSTEAATPEMPDERTVEEKVAEAVRDLKVEQLGKLTEKEKKAGEFEKLYAKLEAEYPGHLPLLMEGLKHVDSEKNRADQLDKVIDATNKVVAEISEDELALHFGKKHDKEDAQSVKERKEMDKKKGFLVEALARRARALADQNKSSEVETALGELKKWIDIDSGEKYAVLVLERERRAKRYGSMLKLLNKLLKSDGEGTKGGIKQFSKADLYAVRAEVLETLGYTELVAHDKKWRLISSPPSYTLF